MPGLNVIGVMAGRAFGSDISQRNPCQVYGYPETAQDLLKLEGRLREKPGSTQKRARPWAETAGGSVEKGFRRSSKELE